MADLNFSIGFNVEQNGQLDNYLKKLELGLNNIGKDNGAARITEELGFSVEQAKKLKQILSTSFDNNGLVNMKGFRQNIEAAGGSMQQFKAEMAGMGQAGQMAFNSMAVGAYQFGQQGAQSFKLLNDAFTTFKNALRYTLSGMVVRGFVSGISDAYNYVKRLDTALNDIRIVTGLASDEMDKFAVKAQSAAKAMGSDTLSYVKGALLYYQQGVRDVNELNARTEVTTKVSNVTNLSTADATQALTAVWNGYKVSAENAEKTIDKLAAVAANSAVDLEYLTTAMSKTAAAANTMGLPIDNLNAMIATTGAVTQQSAETIGTAYKTIIARLSDLKVEGFTEEDGITTTYGDISKQMLAAGIDIKDQNGNLRDTVDLITEIGTKWQDWNKGQKDAVAIAMAGKRQYTQLFALFDNWGMYNDLVKTSANSQGELQKQQDIYMESTAAHLKQLSTEAEKTYSQFFDTEGFNEIIDSITKVVEVFNNLLSGFHDAGAVITNFAGLFVGLFSNQIAGAIQKVITNLEIANNNIKNNKIIKDISKNGGIYSGQEINGIYYKAGSNDVKTVAGGQNHIAAVMTNSNTGQAVELSEQTLWQDLKMRQQIYALQANMAPEQYKITQAHIDTITQLTQEKQNLQEQADLYKNNVSAAQVAKGVGGAQETIAQLTAQHDAFEELISSAYRYSDALGVVAEGNNKAISSNGQDWTNLKTAVNEAQTGLLNLKNVSTETQVEAKKLADELGKALSGASAAKSVEDKAAWLEKINKLLERSRELEGESSQQGINNARAYIQVLGNKLNLTQEEIDKLTQIVELEEKRAKQQQTIQKGIQLGMAALRVLNAGISAMKTFNDEESTGLQKAQAITSSFSSIVGAIGSIWGPAGMMIGSTVGSLAAGILDLTGVTEKWSKSLRSASEISEEITTKVNAAAEAQQKFSSSTGSLKEIEDEWMVLQQKAGEYGENVDKMSEEEQNRYRELVDLMVGYNQDAILGWDEQGNAIVQTNNLLQKTYENLEKIRYIDFKSSYNNFSDYVKDVYEASEKYAKEHSNKKKSGVEAIESNYIGYIDGGASEAILQDVGITRSYEFTNIEDVSNYRNKLDEAIAQSEGYTKTNLEKYKNIIDKYLTDLAEYFEEMPVPTLDSSQFITEMQAQFDFDFGAKGFLSYDDFVKNKSYTDKETGVFNTIIKNQIESIDVVAIQKEYGDKAEEKLEEIYSGIIQDAVSIVDIGGIQDLKLPEAQIGETINDYRLRLQEVMMSYIQNQGIDTTSVEGQSQAQLLMESVLGIKNLQFNDDGSIKAYLDDYTQYIFDQGNQINRTKGFTGKGGQQAFQKAMNSFSKEDLAYFNKDQLGENWDAGAESAEDYEEIIESLIEANKKLAKAEQEATQPDFSKYLENLENTKKGLDKLSSVYGNLINEKKGFEKTDFSDLQKQMAGMTGFDGTDFGTEAFATFMDQVSAVGNSTMSAQEKTDAYQKSVNELATSIVHNTIDFKNLTDETKTNAVAQLEALGITNASAVVEQELASAKLETAYANGVETDSIGTEIEALINEGSITQEQAQIWMAYKLQKEMANITNLTDAQVQQLANEASALGVSISSWKNYYNAKKNIDKLNSAEVVQKDGKTIYKVGNATYSETGYNRMLDYYTKQAEESQKESEKQFQDILSKGIQADVKTVGGGTSRGGSSASKQTSEYDQLAKAIENARNQVEKFDRAYSNASNSDERLSALAAKRDAINKESALLAQARQTYQAQWDAYVKAAKELGITDEMISLIKDGTSLPAEAMKTLSAEQKKAVDNLEEVDDALVEIDEQEDENAKTLEEIWLDEINQIKSKYQEMLAEMEHQKISIEADITLQQTVGKFVDGNQYFSLIDNVKQQMGAQEDLISDLYDKLSEVDEGSDAWNEVSASIREAEEAIQGLRQSVAEYVETLKSIPNNIYSNMLSMVSNNASDINNAIAEATAHGLQTTQAQYEALIKNSAESTKYLERQRSFLQKMLGTYQVGSDKYYEVLTQLQAVDDQISKNTQDTYKWQQSILEISYSYIEEAQSEIDKQINVIQDDIDDIQDQIDDIDDEIEKISRKIELIQRVIDNEEEKQDEWQEIIQAVADAYQDAIDKLTDERTAYEESMNSKIDLLNEQLDLLNENNEALDKQLAIEQALYDLDKAREQQTVRVIRNGKVSYEADQNAVRQAENAYAEALYNKKVYDLQQEIKVLEDERDKQLEAYDDQIEALNEQAEVWSTIVENIEKAVRAAKASEYFGSEDWAIKITGDAEYSKQQADIMSAQYGKSVELVNRLNDEVKVLEDQKLILEDQKYDLNQQIEKLNKQIELLEDQKEILDDTKSTIEDFVKQWQKGQINFDQAMAAIQKTISADLKKEINGNDSQVNKITSYSGKQVQVTQTILDQLTQAENNAYAATQVRTTSTRSSSRSSSGGGSSKSSGSSMGYATVSGISVGRSDIGPGGSASSLATAQSIAKQYASGDVAGAKAAAAAGGYKIETKAEGGVIGGGTLPNRLMDLIRKAYGADAMPLIGHKGELVLNRDQQANLIKNIQSAQLAAMFANPRFRNAGADSAQVISITMGNLTLPNVQNGNDFADFIANNLETAVGQRVNRK